MIEQTGESYGENELARDTYVAGAKEGKTITLLASLLGLMPNQKPVGGIVSRPENLHILTSDMKALGKAKHFLQTRLGAPPEALKYRVYNFEQDIVNAFTVKEGYRHDLFNTLMAVRAKIAERCTVGVHAVLLSSLTGFAAGIERSMMGEPTGTGTSGKGYADVGRWTLFKAQLYELQNAFHSLNAHILWEAHIYKPPKSPQQTEEPKESIQVSGKAGQNWCYNVEGVFRIRKNSYEQWPGTKVDKVAFETRPTFDFLVNGRGFGSLLKEQEFNLTETYMKLGRKVGHWGAVKHKQVSKAVTTTKEQ